MRFHVSNTSIVCKIINLHCIQLNISFLLDVHFFRFHTMLKFCLQRKTQLSKTIPHCRITNNTNILCKVDSIRLVPKRKASIHTRNMLIQKAKLEHIDNFGIFLLVSG